MKVLLIGCGNVGSSLLDQWVSSESFEEIFVVQPSLGNRDKFLNESVVTFVDSMKNLDDLREDITVITVKPQNFKDIVADVRNRNEDSVVVSVLAGVTSSALSRNFPNHKNIIRVMPNLAIRTGYSVNLAFAIRTANKWGIDLFSKTFDKSGEIFFLEKESYIDLLTPIFGSGPAYFFLLADILFNEVQKVGIDSKEAKKMLDLLFVGAASLVNSNLSYSDLISSVSSKKGVTEVALSNIDPSMRLIVSDALQAALKRIEELQNESCY